jgi:hypothetical protein
MGGFILCGFHDMVGWRQLKKMKRYIYFTYLPWRSPDPKSLPPSVSAPVSKSQPRIQTHVLLIRSKGALTKGLASRFRLSGSLQSSLHSLLQCLCGTAHGFDLEKYHLRWGRASESASDVPICKLCAARQTVFYSISGRTYHVLNELSSFQPREFELISYLSGVRTSKQSSS